MSKEYIINVPDDAGFVEYSYIRGGRKYNTHYAYRSMEHLVRCGECKWGSDKQTGEAVYCEWHGFPWNVNGFCSYGEVKDDETD